MNNLKAARKAKGLTQIEVSNFIGLTQGTYSQWENGKVKIDPMSLSRLAKLFDVTTDYLLGKDDQPNPVVLRVPVYRKVPAGIPLEAIEDVVDWEELPQSMAKGGKEYFALRVSGDSMWPEYLDGDVVIVRRAQICTSGDVCVVYVNGYDATLKEVKLDEAAGTLTIVPRNPSYPPRTFTRQEIQELPVTIAGVVVELRRKIK